jgi:hypothetical protein
MKIGFMGKPAKGGSRMMRGMKFLGCITIIFAMHGIASGAPIRTLPDLVSVTFYEQTFGRSAVVYAPNDAKITARLANPLSDSNRDFSFFTTENYDVFYSDANGVFNLDGAFLTIEGVLTASSGGMNINEVELTFGGSSPHTQFGDFVASFVYGSNCGFCIPGSEANAVDHNLGTFPRFGATNPNNPNERFRLTIGFNDISQVPETSTVVLVSLGLGGLAVARGRRSAATRT